MPRTLERRLARLEESGVTHSLDAMWAYRKLRFVPPHAGGCLTVSAKWHIRRKQAARHLARLPFAGASCVFVSSTRRKC
jgi:hypothetical protein